MSVEANKDVVRVIFDGFNSGDIDRVAAICADDFVLEDVPAGLTLKGPEGMRAWLGNWLTAAPDAHADLQVIYGEGDLVATEHHGTATHTGPLGLPDGGTLPPTGRRLDLWFGEFYKLRDGKLVSMRAYYDLATVLRQLGLMDG
jgi:steroid delta-isomerase-like uncharacterized protein